jgi:hypothetical protein
MALKRLQNAGKQRKVIYRFCSRQSTKEWAVSAKKNILFYFCNNQAHSWWATAHAILSPFTV